MASPPSQTDFLNGLVHILALERAELLSKLEGETQYFREEDRRERDLRTLTGDSAAMRRVRQAIQQVASADSTVLIQGETGTGKELVARAIHQLSPRRQGLMVKVNCAALSPGLLASELFGHEPGAFTGAVRRRIGRFELAHGGTLFLDEVGELPAETQVMLLRVLQEKVIERVGGNEPIAVDDREIAATNRDLADLVAAGRFRADLYYRLNVFPIALPPLRERPEDIADLVRHFLHHFNRRMKRQVVALAPESLRLLKAYGWPGNVRELENIMERAMIVATCDALSIDPGWLAERRVSPTSESVGGKTWLDVERSAIESALEKSGGRIYGPRGAAVALGLKPSTLYGKMRRLGIANHHPA